MVPSQPLVNSPSISPVPGARVDSTQNYSENARVFLQSNTLADYYQAAKGIEAEASACSDSGFLDKKLPHDLTYLHMACLVQDLGFLNRLLAMDECAE